MKERKMTRAYATLDVSWLLSVHQVYCQMIKHFTHKFTDPVEAINKATDVLVKYYNIEE